MPRCTRKPGFRLTRDGKDVKQKAIAETEQRIAYLEGVIAETKEPWVMQMLERKAFSGGTLAEVKQAADEWWDKQTGLERVTDFGTTVGDHLVLHTGDRWTHTIVYRRITVKP